jgi:ParB-like chromosome segregation protein Spo0J
MKVLEEELRLKLELVRLDCLKEHEGTEHDRLRRLTKEIQEDGLLKKAIAVDVRTFVVIDGHHRLNALKLLGCRKIPVCFIDYSSPLIEVSTWTNEIRVTKKMVIEAAKNGSKLPPRTTRHLIKVSKDKVRHISYIEKDVNIPLEDLS